MVNEWIDEAIKTGDKCFDIYQSDLTALPPEIGKLTNLTELDLTLNELTELPIEIGELINLTELDLSCNPLTTLPHEIGKLKK